MVEWRDRGFVQDSDQEDESEVSSVNLDDHELNKSNSFAGVVEDLRKRVQDLKRNVEVAVVIGVKENPEYTKEDINCSSRDRHKANATQNTQSRTSENTLITHRHQNPDSFDSGHSIEDVDSYQLRTDSLVSLPSSLGKKRKLNSPILHQSVTGLSRQVRSDTKRDIFDIPSSPLSDIPASPAPYQYESQPSSTDLPISPHGGFTSKNAIHTLPSKLVSGTASRSRSPVSAVSPMHLPTEYIEDMPGLQLEEQQANARTRTFRPRNPIQLHPYVLEHEQYRNTLRARGIRPVLVVGPHIEQALVAESDSQYVLETGRSSPFEPGSPMSLSSSPLAPPIRGSQIHPGTDHSEVHSRTPESESLEQASKRQALTQPRSQPRHQARFAMESEEYRGEMNGLPRELFTANSSDPVVPNPLTSVVKDRGRKKYRLKKFKTPLGFLKNHLPTPDTSSETGLPELATHNLHTHTEFELDSDHDGDPPSIEPEIVVVQTSQSTKARTRSPSPSSRESSSDESERIRAAQRRIRGVLPASYLTLQQRAQTQSRSKSIGRPLKHGGAFKDKIVRGIARRIIADVQPSDPDVSLSNAYVEISDDSDNIDPNLNAQGETLSTPASHVGMPYLPRLDAETQDVIEDNWIDPMVPTETRNRRKNLGYKSQLSLEEAFKKTSGVYNHVSRQQSGNSHDIADRSHFDRQNRYHTDRARKKPRLKLSVIDSGSLVLPGSRPDFLKVAIRQARFRADGGRHRPLGKVLSFHNRREEAEIRTTLHEWAKGSTSTGRNTHSTIIKSISQRKPFTELSQNHQQKLPTLVKPVGVPSSTPNYSRQGRLNALPVKPRLRQKRLNVTRQVHNRPSLKHPVPADDTSNVLVARRKTVPVRQQVHLRPGQLEDENDEDHQETAFQKELLNRDSGFNESCMYANPLLNTYLNENSSHSTHAVFDAQQRYPEVNDFQEPPDSISQRRTINRRRWKRPPQRTNVDDFDIDIGSTFELLSNYEMRPPARPIVVNSLDSLKGLGKFGTFYTSDFEVRHLPVGSYFHQSTFIGSGEFQAALTLNQRDIDQPAGFTSFLVGSSRFRWGPWTDEVSTEISKFFDDIQSTLAQESPYELDVEKPNASEALLSCSSILRSVLLYISSNLHFLDAVDRIAFLERVLQDIQNLSELLRMTHSCDKTWQQTSVQYNKSAHVRLTTYTVVILYQMYCIAEHPLIQIRMRKNIETALRSMVCLLTATLLRNNLQELWTFTSTKHRQIIQQAGFREEHVEVESILILSYILPRLHLDDLGFWVAFEPAFAERLVTTYTNVVDFDKTWHDLYSILPILAFEPLGVLGSKDRTELSGGHWTVVRAMLYRLFDLYSSTIATSETTMNSYIRATFGRCFNLVHRWQWRNAEIMLNCIFDFFARNGLSLLQHEDSKGSPAFVTSLGNVTSVNLEPCDRSFDIFLKSLYIALKQLSLSYPVKKLRSIAWRFIPNGGRLLEKEKEVCQNDLSTRRNHHDLLCVLYSALPPASRPSVDLIKNLVDFVSSHSEICRINIRSWANLVYFQLSTEEPKEAMIPFAEWYNKFLAEMIVQHRNARIEAESQFTVSTLKGVDISTNLLESTIARNQKQTESLIVMALACLRDSIKHGKNAANTLSLFKALHIASILELFNPKLARFDGVIIVALEVYDAFLERVEQPNWNAEQLQNNGDSQEFGDWSGLDDVIDVGTCSFAYTIDDTISTPIEVLLSNCFGVESFFNDSLLMKLTDTWLRLCLSLVRSGDRDLSYYLNQHSPGSWQKLRSTDHSRKFFPYFIASILTLADKVGATHEDAFIMLWMASLVERESMLKFQDRLTTAIINAYPQNPLLQNLPFVLKPGTLTVKIDLDQLRERRLAIISSVLANMRHNFEAAAIRSASEAQQIRLEYSLIIRHFMSTMKSIYQETQHGSSTRGDYVELVQKIVEFLQQYTNNICPIDPFFTDSAAFPLPISDPTYVVGKLKGYAFGLSDIRAQKKLAIFIQSICERAVVENQQDYLVGQLRKAVEGFHEQGILCGPSLRTLLIHAILPAYLELLFTSDCGWILANTLLDAATHIFDDLIFCFSVTDVKSRGAVSSMVTDFLVIGFYVAHRISTDSDLLNCPRFLRTLSSVYRAITNVIGVLDFVHRSNGGCEQAIGFVARLIDISKGILGEQHDGQYQLSPVDSCISTGVADSSGGELRAFCKRGLEASLSKNWIKYGDVYYVLRGSSRTEVIIDVGTLEEEKGILLGQTAEFLNVMRRMPAFRGMLPPQADPAKLFERSVFF